MISNLKKKLMKSKTSIIVSVLLIIAAFAAGRYSTPEKVRIVEKIKTVEVVKEVEKKSDISKNKDVIKKNHQTRTVVTEYPDGRKVTEVYTVNKDTIFIDRRNKSETEKKTESKKVKFKHKVVEKTNNKSDWLVGGVVKFDYDKIFQKPSYGIKVDKRLFGPVFVGGQLMPEDKSVGLTLSWSF